MATVIFLLMSCKVRRSGHGAGRLGKLGRIEIEFKTISAKTFDKRPYICSHLLKPHLRDHMV